MSNQKTGIYQLLKVASVYDLSQQFLRPWKSRADFVSRRMRPVPGDRVLDIGCGTASVIRHLPTVRYVGIDTNKRYIDRAKARFADTGDFRVGDIRILDELPNGSFDLTIALGVMHHLPDSHVTDMLHNVARLLRTGGRFVSHDPVWTDGQSYWSRWWVARDRGQHVRSESSLLELVRPHFAEIASTITHDSLRIPFSEIVLECRAA